MTILQAGFWPLTRKTSRTIRKIERTPSDWRCSVPIPATINWRSCTRNTTTASPTLCCSHSLEMPMPSRPKSTNFRLGFLDDLAACSAEAKAKTKFKHNSRSLHTIDTDTIMLGIRCDCMRNILVNLLGLSSFAQR
ncbi:hypothetical protein HII31_07906 [Pseudocercospora fuligena]|uniref:Uncharacterized protein n=1 Tax=Pseudocercospora fuligena TaxID=685502 RepID=A0A8H6RHN5_9PEZI|nr:hypothetical protein HII31_07906 [Pseudocercospora fuligena]